MWLGVGVGVGVRVVVWVSGDGVPVIVWCLLLGLSYSNGTPRGAASHLASYSPPVSQQPASHSQPQPATASHSQPAGFGDEAPTCGRFGAAPLLGCALRERDRRYRLHTRQFMHLLAQSGGHRYPQRK